jgi:hypothetical protein
VNLREAINEYVAAHRRCQDIGMEGNSVEKIRKRFGEPHERFDRAVVIAAAAVAHCEYCESVRFALFGQNVVKLRGPRSAIIEARLKAKASKQS